MVFPYEREAKQGGPMPDGLTLPDCLTFQFLRSMYRDIRTGVLSVEQAVLEKGQMTYSYKKAIKEMKNWSKMGRYWTNKYKAVEAAQNAYRKNRTLENADRLSAALDGRL